MNIENVLPGYRINEYKIVLDPHSDLQNRITKVQKEFNDEVKITTRVASRVNLVLVIFSQYEMMEERIMNHLKTIALGYPPFKVELKDFGSFPTHRIFINVISKLPIQNLTRKIRSETGRLMKLNDDNKPYFITEPIFNIASKLLPWQYEKGWLSYSNKNFTGRFIADAMLLLKRENKSEPWKIVQRLEFQNLPVNTKQGELFI